MTMRTLDEVIKGFECCQNVGCDKCPYKILFNDDTHVPCDQLEKDEDAFYYLKEYRSEKRLWEADRKGYLDWIEQYKEAREKHQQAVIELKKNPPLTWDELKAMEGKPVWVEVYDPIDEKTGWHTASWKLIEFINDEYFVVRDSDGAQDCFYKSENDSYCWHAYRKERK